MAAAPELAPENQNHLLQTSSVVQSIDYKTGQINYTKFDADSTELFKLGAARPTSVNGGRWHWDASKKLLAVQANRNSVQIALEPSQRQ
jgi:hypothetical protein